MAKKLVIIGWGFAWLRVYYKLKNNKNFDIKLIDPRISSSMKPVMPEVAFEGMDVEKSKISFSKIFSWNTFINAWVEKVDAKNNKIILDNKEELEYDYLVVAAWSKKDFWAVKGLEENGYSMCDDTHAPKLWKALEKFDGGTIVIWSAASKWGNRVDAPKWEAPCEGPIWEAMFMVRKYLLEKWIYDKTKIEVFTPWKIFFEDVWEVGRWAIWWLMKKFNMNLYNSKIVKEVKKDLIEFEDGTSLKSDLTMMIPIYKWHDFVFKSEIWDENWMIPTDKKMRHLDYKNIFSAGDANALSMPKLGHIAIIQADIVVASLLNQVWEKISIPEFKPEVLCIMNMGWLEAWIVLSDIQLWGKYDVVWHGSWQWLAKKSFDFYNIITKWKMPPKIGEHLLKKAILAFWVGKK